MFAFLLVLGTVVIAAGLSLVVSGVSVQDHMFDATKVTPGTIAVIGGCILVGLAFVVRALLRVERALMTRTDARPMRPTEAGAVTGHTEDAARIPFPPKPKTVSRSQPAPAPAASVQSASSEAPATAAQGPPAMERIENAPVVPESDVSLLPRASSPAEDEHGGRTNGAAHAAPQLATGGRLARQPRQAKSIFDSLWPRPQRAASETQAAPVNAGAPAQSQLESAPAAVAAPMAPMLQPASPAQEPEAAAVLSILKSGVVGDMAYTLYSDGSIEAQLPDGTLRFGSIAELRHHLEQNG